MAVIAIEIRWNAGDSGFSSLSLKKKNKKQPKSIGFHFHTGDIYILHLENTNVHVCLMRLSRTYCLPGGWRFQLGATWGPADVSPPVTVTVSQLPSISGQLGACELPCPDHLNGSREEHERWPILPKRKLRHKMLVEEQTRSGVKAGA